MPELLWAEGGVCQNFWGLRGGYVAKFGGSTEGMLEFCGLRAGYAGTFLGSRGGMLELSWYQGGGYAGIFVGSGGGGMPELLWA